MSFGDLAGSIYRSTMILDAIGARDSRDVASSLFPISLSLSLSLSLIVYTLIMHNRRFAIAPGKDNVVEYSVTE